MPSLLILFTPSEHTQSRVAFTVTRKVGNAVIRNRVKRWLREAVRQQVSSIPDGKDIVVIAHPQSVNQQFLGLSDQLQSAWKQMERVAE